MARFIKEQQRQAAVWLSHDRQPAKTNFDKLAAEMITTTTDVFEDILDSGAVVTSPKLQERITPANFSKIAQFAGDGRQAVREQQLAALRGRKECQTFKALAAEGGRHGARAHNP